jgi:hypothetical protein
MAFKPAPAPREQTKELRLIVPMSLYQRLESLGQDSGVDISECARQALAYATGNTRRRSGKES